VSAHFDNFGQPVSLTYTLRQEGGVWRIHDIQSDQGSLRAMLNAI
jgi:ABC-type transporter MlaC component